MDIRDFLSPSCDLLALGEPTHLEPAFPLIRNDLLVRLVDLGFRSVALETDRVAALAVDDYVRGGGGTLDGVMREGFSPGFGELDGNRRLVAWLREHNEHLPPADRVAFHGFDAPIEMMSAPSPLRHLDHVRAYLGLDVDLAALAGDDERWSRTEAIMDPNESVGATPEADRLRVIADDLLVTLHARAPELIAATSRAAWTRAEVHLTAGLGLLRYHRQSAEHVERATRVSRQLGVRDALMARNLLDIRAAETGRGPTLVFAQNLHLQRNPSRWHLGGMDLCWSSAGSIVGALVGERYAFVAGSLGRSAALGLGEPDPDTYEGALQHAVTGWGLVRAHDVAPARTRTDTTPAQGYFPLDRPTLDGADAVLHVTGR
ncbi:erythromycin esterase family protein [Umezawaea sp. NPDC059074]|uniref:erythromycin esterase family protein n=1 Tax=Umezawaea sp. NPDC059074 TaxID=3346716 RepID=UPI0036CDE8F1